MKQPITDAHVWLGRWPFGPLAAHSAEEILGKMDQLGIARAVVTAPQAILYKDVQRANDELARAAQPAGERFLSAATLNPGEPGWERDLEEVRTWGMRILNLHPNYHAYDVVGRQSMEAIHAATSLGWPVLITVRMQDERQQHRLGRVAAVPVPAIANAIRAMPGSRFLIRGLTYFEMQELQKLAGSVPDWWVSIERVHVPQNVIPLLVNEIGVDRLVFGSMYPFQYLESTWLKVAGATDLSDAESEAILSRNAAVIFGEPSG